MSDPETLQDWVEEEYDPEDQTPTEFVNDHEFPNAAAAAIAIDTASDIRRSWRRGQPLEDTYASTVGQGDDQISGVDYDTKADRLRETASGRFIGWVEAAVKYIRKLGRF